MESLPAKDAQRKENIVLRDKQVEEGVTMAEQMGLGVWKVSRPGREFVRCDDAPNS